MNSDPDCWRNPRLAARIVELDGVRGLAVLLIVGFHYFVQSTEVSSHWLGALLGPLHIMVSGVDLFFVLSGFLIGGILFDARFAQDYFSAFYGRRICRIFPVYFLWLFLFAVGLMLVRNEQQTYLRRLFNLDVPLWLYPLFLQNIYTAFHHEWGSEWLSATWSLAVEEQFYLVLPFLIRILSARAITLVTLAAIGFALLSRWILVMHGNETHGPYTLLPCRADDLGMGVLIAIVCRHRSAWSWLTVHRRHILAAFLLLGLGVSYLALHPAARLISTIGYSWIGLFYSTLILILVVHPGAIARGVFSSWILTRLGKYSYAIYIFHYGIFGLCHYFVFHRAPLVRDGGSLLLTLLALILTLVCAAISWRFMEGPLIAHAGRRFRYDYDPGSSAPDAGCETSLAAPSVSRGT
jgi:peptidoglycan/LPS O-acetylase OafA/YrhL